MAKFFKVHSCACKNALREANHALLGVIYDSLARLDISPCVQNFIALALAIPEIRMGPSKFKTGYRLCDITMPLLGTV